MYLKFIIDYESPNGYVCKVAKEVAKKLNINIGLKREDDKTLIFMELDEDKINSFANELDKSLAKSIFLGKIDAVVVDEFENEEIKIYDFSNELIEIKDNLITTKDYIYEVSEVKEDSDLIIAKDLNSVAKHFVAFNGDEAIAFREHPILHLKVNINFRTLTNLFSVSSYDVKLTDEYLEEFFEKFDTPLIGVKVIKDNSLKGVVTDTKNHKFIITSGEKYLVLPPQKEYDENKKPYFGYFGVLNQYNLNDKNTMAFPFYKKHPSKVLLNSPKFGLVDYVDFDVNYTSFEEIFAEISLDESGKKLIKNFSTKEPKLFENALNSDLKTDYKGIYFVWGLIGCVLGFGKNIEESAKKLLELANDALTKKGPRIDYKLKDKNLDASWAIRTAMSFKLAGVDDNLISYGVIESFAEFLNNLYEGVNRDTELHGAIIVGDLFEGEFLNKTYTYVSKNYPTFTPKALPISGAIEGYGAFCIE